MTVANTGVAADMPSPVVHWSMSALSGSASQSQLEGVARPTSGEKPRLVDGPQGKFYPDFSDGNAAVDFSRGGYIAIADEGEQNLLDFEAGDEITISAWIKIDQSLKSPFPYIIGKGRTFRKKEYHANQNYALRLAKLGAGAAISFLYSDTSSPNMSENGQRWTSTSAVPIDQRWHHVAVTYRFASDEVPQGYIDGKEVKMKSDMHGAQRGKPVTDDDELWIGASMGGQQNFPGAIDEVALYRQQLTAEQIKNSVHIVDDRKTVPFAEVDSPPVGEVLVSLYEGVDPNSWSKILVREPDLQFIRPAFGITHVPFKYSSKGHRLARRGAWLVHMSADIHFEEGDHRFLLRSLNASKLYIDGKEIASTPFHRRGGAHNEIYELDPGTDDLIQRPAAHRDEEVTIHLDGGVHRVELYRISGKSTRIGEMMVATAKPAEKWEILASQHGISVSDLGWRDYVTKESEWLHETNRKTRLSQMKQEMEYWQRRHEYAQQIAGNSPEVPATKFEGSHQNSIDSFINARLDTEGVQSVETVSDLQFMRRLYLDFVGVIPTLEEVQQFESWPEEDRKERLIQQLLEDDRWADHWVSYWQDVLAENPGLTKPSLNNTGPFRWYLYEALLDNRGWDQVVTDLIMMEGSSLEGAPAAFGVASQNDVPMAAKAHILGTAFLAVEMKCARCHDAPYHDVTQEDLFNIAAMLDRKAVKIPGTSSIPATPEQLAQMAVKVTLKPGQAIEPAWPFDEFSSPKGLPKWIVRNPDNSRENLAAIITRPSNQRFAQVMVNRIWTRLTGVGIVEVSDDWQEAEIRQPELLSYLSHEFISHGYDIKYLAGLIVRSHTYQRRIDSSLTPDSPKAALFAAACPTVLSAEQLVDSVYTAVGKDLGSEELTYNDDGQQNQNWFNEFGVPKRAWEMIGIANGRDRPSMALPTAQSLSDLLSAYGWRSQRQEPVSHRQDANTPLQPMLLAYGDAGARLADISDNGVIVKDCLTSGSPEEMLDKLYLRIWTRRPTESEQSRLLPLIRHGFDSRVISGIEPNPPRIYRIPATWSNHLDDEANSAMLERLAEVSLGDPPTRRLNDDWRKSIEDIIWAMLNAPESLFSP
ncbi:DUF1553 domain-containing protein [Calycomorphotria hydatis]|nr:DUF1553 domain-containing protein [Calycomorphotria hydatis]